MTASPGGGYPWSELTTGDWARYAGLLAMGSLVFLVVYGDRNGRFLGLVACYLLLAAVLGIAVLRHRRRS